MARSRDYQAERRHRTVLKVVRGRSDYERLRPREREARHKVFEALSEMRNEKVSLRVAARRHGTTPETVRRYAGNSMVREGRRYVPTLADRSYQRMSVLSSEGVVDIDVRGSRARSAVGRHWNSIQRFAATGDVGVLTPFVGKRVGGAVLATDPDQIEEFLHRREIDIDDIYITAA
jgi:hypothetical protein